MNEKELLKICYDIFNKIDDSTVLNNHWTETEMLQAIGLLQEHYKTEKSTLKNAFDLFWDKYPLKIGKKQCSEHWKKCRISVSLFDTIMSSLEKQINHKKEMDNRKEFCPEFPHPIRWLKHCRWEDEVPVISKGNWSDVYKKPNYDNLRDER